ncbi:MAG: DUF3846 domain-containing protein [Candidatus Saccharimonadales bacterium]
MATFIPVIGKATGVMSLPLTLTAMQTLVGGFIRFVDLTSGDVMVINESSLDRLGFYNKTASNLAGQSIYGDVVVCEPTEIA